MQSLPTLAVCTLYASIILQLTQKPPFSGNDGDSRVKYSLHMLLFSCLNFLLLFL